jgi:hypothetical protein
MAINSTAAVLSSVNTIAFTGSVDGTLTAAVARGRAAADCVAFPTQAFAVDKIDPSTWAPNRRVLLVDLAVNNRKEADGRESGFEMTCGFVRKVLEAGHQIVGVCDEHDANDWRRVCEAVGIDFDLLGIKPVSQKTGPIKSSGALLASLLAEEANERERQLLADADAGDRMQFTGPFGAPANKAMKARIQDDSRRVHLVEHFAQHSVPDTKILEWVAEYEVIEENHRKVVASIEDLGDGIIRASAVGLTVDMTTLMGLLYKRGKVVVLVGETFDKGLGRKVASWSFGIPTGKGDILAVVKAAGVPCSGFTEKVNTKPEDGQAAIEAVRAWLKAQS